MKFSFIIPVSDETILEDNVLRSQIYKNGCHEFIFQRGYRMIAKAYNDAVAKAGNDILIFMHQDVFLPEAWERKAIEAILNMDDVDKQWGVLGVAGVKPVFDSFGKRLNPMLLGHIRDRSVEWGRPDNLPQRIQTLDEQVLMVRKDNAYFDEKLPGNHFYGVDLCMRLAMEGKKSYAIAAYLHHNSAHYWLEEDYYQCQQYIHDKYYESLPIETTSGPVLKDRLPLYFENALARSDLVQLMPCGVKRILEVGTGMGKTGQLLQDMGYKNIVGVEISHVAAAHAAQFYENLLIGDVEKLTIPYKSGYFDVIMYGDVLEHLVNPWSVISRHYSLLKRGGTVIASIPNIRHYSVLRKLFFRGRWDYKHMGILDRTHLRFFTKKTMCDMFERSGYKVLKFIPMYKAPRVLRKINKYLGNIFTDFLALQYTIVAIKNQQDVED